MYDVEVRYQKDPVQRFEYGKDLGQHHAVIIIPPPGGFYVFSVGVCHVRPSVCLSVCPSHFDRGWLVTAVSTP